MPGVKGMKHGENVLANKTLPRAKNKSWDIIVGKKGATMIFTVDCAFGKHEHKFRFTPRESQTMGFYHRYCIYERRKIGVELGAKDVQEAKKYIEEYKRFYFG